MSFNIIKIGLMPTTEMRCSVNVGFPLYISVNSHLFPPSLLTIPSSLLYTMGFRKKFKSFFDKKSSHKEPVTTLASENETVVSQVIER